MDIQPLNNVAPASTTAPDRTVQAAAPPAHQAVPVEVVTAVQQPATVPTQAELDQAVKNINKTLQEQNQGLEFTVDSDTQRTIVKVVDQKTKEVLRQIPSEEALEISKALDNFQKGLLIRQKV